MEDLMIDIFLLCLIANKQGPDVYTHDYYNNWFGVMRHRQGSESVAKIVNSVSDGVILKNYLESVINGSKGDESIWE